MKTYIILSLFLFVSVLGFSQVKKPTTYNLLLTGASFASDKNGWFEIGCETIGAQAINRAVDGETIVNTANKMYAGILYSPEELETLDALVIMHTHNQNVMDSSQLKDDYRDYKLPFDNSNYARAYDYVIKKYITDCYNKKDDPASRYYGKKEGKPAAIILCTDWHDARTIYNTSIRELAKKWGLPLVEFDKNIGFSKNQLHPVTKDQYSLLYSYDTQVIDGVRFGWHPGRGKQQYIQQRLGAIFANTLSRFFN